MSVDLAGFLGVVLLAYLVPGPDFLVVVRAAAQRASVGRAAAVGAQAGLCVHMCAAAMGLSVIAARSAVAFSVIKLAGAAYLVYLGVRALRDARRKGGATGAGGKREREAVGCRGGFTQGLLTNVLNPKAALFFLSVLPQFVDRDGGGSVTGQVFLLGAIDVAIGLVYWLALVQVAARLRAVFGRPGWRRRWERVGGWLFIALGVGVAATE
ncbi:LysE family translocator [Streptomyces sp. NPDC048182]|uniref:LysE family translocator n=1 Tax=Streptomyces sp. NPDC048182 TaxID=3365507 RepID=UPI00372396EC